MSTAGCSGATPASSITRSASAAASAIAAAEPLYVVALDAAGARVIVGPREALATRRIRLRDVNWLGDGRLEDLAARRPRHRGARALDARASAGEADARRRRRVLEAETGVSPGQACVFYASTAPQARVLGGGFIQAVESPALAGRTVAMAAHPQ